MKRRTLATIILTLLLTTTDCVVGIKLDTDQREAKLSRRESLTTEDDNPDSRFPTPHFPLPIFKLESVLQPAVAQLETEASVTSLGRIVTADSQVRLKRQGWSDYRPVPVGTPLYRGDLLWPNEGARVVVICANGKNWTVPAGVASGANNGCPLPQRPEPMMRQRQPTDSRIASDIPYIISPRNTAVLNNKPTLRWNPVPGATRYTVRVSGSEVDWKTTVSTSEIVYPGEPPLEPGVDYSLIVTADNTQASAQTTFRRLDDDEAQQVQAQAEQFIQPEWSSVAKALVLTDLYTEHQLIAEAIEKLDVLVNQGSQISTIYHTLGDLYLQVGLNPLAEQHYLKAIALATDANDIAGQSAAQRGLINLAQSYILKKEYTAAQELLLKDLEWVQEDKVNYYRLTHLGWMQLEQSRLDEAQVYLQQAINQDSELGLAYCLLAMVLEAKGDSLEVVEARQNCSQKPSPG